MTSKYVSDFCCYYFHQAPFYFFAHFLTLVIAPKNRPEVYAKYLDDSRIIVKKAGKGKNTWERCRKIGEEVPLAVVARYQGTFIDFSS